jgi:hypothetical protein
MSFTPVNTRSLDDPATDSMRRTHERAISELQLCDGVQLQAIGAVTMAAGADVIVAHKLGRRPSIVMVGAPRGATATPGIVRDLGDTTSAGATVDRTRAVCLRADGYGVTITVDVAVA